MLAPGMRTTRRRPLLPTARSRVRPAPRHLRRAWIQEPSASRVAAGGARAESVLRGSRRPPSRRDARVEARRSHRAGARWWPVDDRERAGTLRKLSLGENHRRAAPTRGVAVTGASILQPSALRGPRGPQFSGLAKVQTAHCGECGGRVIAGICPYGDHAFVRNAQRSRDAGRFCSREHAHAYQRLHRLGGRGWQPAQWRPALVVFVFTCRFCGIFYGSRRPGRAHCGAAECRRRWSRDDHFRRNSARKDRSPRECVECRGRFVPEYGDKRRRFCSDECGRRYARRPVKRARKARQRGVAAETFDSREIYARDRWRCQLCGGRILRRAAVPHPHAATVDHIVPLADGGAHTRDNVQAAHFECNWRKGASACGSQLRLIG